MSEFVVDVSELVKDYRGLRPLRMRRLSLAAGDQVAVLGMDEPSAEMLTTLLTGAVAPDAGTITVLGTVTATLADTDEWLKLVEQIGLVSDRAALLEMFTVVQNLALPFTLDVDPVQPDVRAQVISLAAEVGLPETTWEQPIATLDGDLKTRVRLGRALALDPRLLVLEHPTALVERSAVRRLAQDVQQVAQRRGLTTLTLTADAEFADAAGARALEWDPARGTLQERKRGWWPWKRS